MIPVCIANVKGRALETGGGARVAAVTPARVATRQGFRTRLLAQRCVLVTLAALLATFDGIVRADGVTPALFLAAGSGAVVNALLFALLGHLKKGAYLNLAPLQHILIGKPEVRHVIVTQLGSDEIESSASV